MLDLSIGKIAIIAVLALFLIGPEKLPQYAAQLARWVRVARSMTEQAKQRVASEMGPEFEDVDWASLDPRRYSPKRMLQDAWNRPLDDGSAGRAAGAERALPAASREPDLLELEDARAGREAASLPGRVAADERPYDLS